MSNVYSYCPVCATPLETRVIDNFERRACPACEFVHWNNPLPVVAALVEHNGMMILARNHGWHPKMFGLITGFIERDEAADAAAAREVKEELDLDTARTEFIGIYPFSRANQIIIAYYVVANGEIRLNEELAEVRLLPPHRLRPSNFGTGLAIRDWLHSRGITPEPRGEES